MVFSAAPLVTAVLWELRSQANATQAISAAPSVGDVVGFGVGAVGCAFSAAPLVTAVLWTAVDTATAAQAISAAPSFGLVHFG